MLGNSCNFACSYCPASLHDGSVGWQEISAVTAFLNALHRHYAAGLGRTVWLQFTGGEPTQYPKFFDLMEAAGDLGLKRSVISNGSRTARFWEKAVARIDSLILTYHHGQVDHEGFLRTCRIAAGALPMHINVTAHPEHFDTILARVEDIRAAAPAASITLKPLRVGFGTQLYPYSPQQMERLSRRITAAVKEAGTFPRGTMRMVAQDGTEKAMRANDFILQDLNRWRGYRCAAGLESLRIKADGTITRAVCGSGGALGRLGGPVTFPVVPVTCDRDRCGCVADILITKRRSHAQAR